MHTVLKVNRSIPGSDDASAITYMPPVVMFDPQGQETLAQQIQSHLCRDPHTVLLRGLEPTEDRSVAVAIAQSIAALPPVKPEQPVHRRGKVSFTKVRINNDVATAERRSTAYSRTNAALALHTDSSYKPAPHELVAFQMVHADATGGDTTLMSVETILQSIDPEIATLLARPIFPFGKGDFPILWQQGGAPRIRYYRNQINNAVLQGAHLSGVARSAIDALDNVLDRADLRAQFRLEEGDILFLDNTRVLHGRTGFDSDSNRLMYRVRVEAGCLV